MWFHNRQKDEEGRWSRYEAHVAALGSDGVLQVFVVEGNTYVGVTRKKLNEDTGRLEPVSQVITKGVARVFAPTHWREVVAEEWGSWTENEPPEYTFKE